MTGKRIVLSFVAVSVCLALGQTAERAGNGLARPVKKTIALASSPVTALKVSAQQKSVSAPKEDQVAVGRKSTNRQPVAAPRDDKASASEKSVTNKTESAPRVYQAPTQGWWTKPRTTTPTATRVRTKSSPTPTTEDEGLRVPTKKSLPSEETRRGTGGSQVDHGRGGRGGRGGWYGGRHHDFDYWRYGNRHRHHHGFWGWHWWFGPIIYIAPDYPPHVVRIPHNRAGVYVRATGDDALGSRFAYELREQLREQGLRVVYDEDDAALELYLVSMDLDPNETGNGSAISVSYVWFPGQRFITAQLLDVGADQVHDLAEDVAGYADDIIDEYR